MHRDHQQDDKGSDAGWPRTDAGGGSNLADILIFLGLYRRMLVVVPLATALVAVVVSLLLPKYYTARTVILPPQQGQSTAAAMLNQLGGLAALAGGAGAIKSPTDLYVGILRSETIANALIDRFKLKSVYDTSLMVEARKALAAETSILADMKSGLISIDVEARDPGLAADLANAYVEELHKLTSGLAVTEAAQRRVFFEQQFQQARDQLAQSEFRLREGLESSGFVSVDAQSRALAESIARLRSQIAAKEIQIGMMRAYATASNPDVQRAQEELRSFRTQLARLEAGVPSEATGGGNGEKTPVAGLMSIRLLRDVKYNEVLFELMAKQYEIARVDESKEAPLVQVVDRATPPEKRSKPKRALIVVLATAAGVLVGFLAALGRHAARIIREDPHERLKAAQVYAVWRGDKSAGT